MRFDPDRCHRRSIRLAGYDYSKAGAYFVTVCSHQRACLFGEIVSGEMHLNEAGEVVSAVWEDLPKHYPHLDLDAFVIMPNHIHGVLVLTDSSISSPSHGLPEILRAFKTFSARRINKRRKIAGLPVWQRTYYERVVRNVSELERIRQYIAENPAAWEWDQENPTVLSSSKR